MNTKTTQYICPNCKKQISEFAVACPNCGRAFDQHRPIQTENVIHSKPKIHTTKLIIFGIILSVSLGIVSTFVLCQALLAWNVYIGASTLDGLLLFRSLVSQGSLRPIAVYSILSVILLILAIMILVLCILKMITIRAK